MTEMSNYLKQWYPRTITVLLVITTLINVHCIPINKRLDLLDIEYGKLTDPHLLNMQRHLVKKFGTLEVLGTLIQYPDGSIYTGDFGQNLHDKDDNQIMPYELDQRLDEMQERLEKFILERLAEEIAIKTNPNLARFWPVFLL